MSYASFLLVRFLPPRVKNESFTCFRLLPSKTPAALFRALAGSVSVGSSFRVDTGPRLWLVPLLVRIDDTSSTPAILRTSADPTIDENAVRLRSSKTTTCLRARLKSQLVHRREALNALRVARDARDDGVGQRAHSNRAVHEGHA